MLTVLTLAVQIIASLASPVDASALNNKRTDPLPLKTLATNKGKYFGTSILSPWFANPTYASTETAQFGQITPDNEMKFGHIHPGQNTWNFTGSDLVMAQAKKQGALVRGHNFVWELWNPDWLTRITDPTTLKAVLKTHITTVFNRYPGHFYAFDVINEPMNWDGSWAQSVWYNVLGEDYIGIAELDIAHAAAPGVKLYINEYDIEGGTGPKAATFLAMVKKLVAQKKPLHGIGFQCHFIGGKVPTTIAAAMKVYTDLGLDVAITELDVRLPVSGGAAGVASAANLQQQAKDYSTVINACLATPRCPGITVWGWDDRDSWVPGAYPGYGAAHLADYNYIGKPAYYSTVAALGG